jgi:hypothetical protein
LFHCIGKVGGREDITNLNSGCGGLVAGRTAVVRLSQIAAMLSGHRNYSIFDLPYYRNNSFMRATLEEREKIA